MVGRMSVSALWCLCHLFATSSDLFGTKAFFMVLKWSSVVGWSSAWLLLYLYTIATVFQLYEGGDMMYEKEKARAYTFTDSKDPLPPTPYRHGMIGTGLGWHCTLYTVGKSVMAQLNVIAVTVIHTSVPRVTLPHALINWANPAPTMRRCHWGFIDLLTLQTRFFGLVLIVF